MKYILNAGINPTQQVTELALMKLSVAIRATVGFSKKVVFKMMREMKNGALWLCYAVDGVKCSTFVKAASFAHLLAVASADLQQIKADYCKSLKTKFPQISIGLDAGVILISIPTDKGYKTYYVTEERGNTWGLYLRKGQSVARARYSSLPSLISNLLNNPIF